MNLNRCLGTVFFVLALVGCVATGPGQASHAPYLPDNSEDAHHDRGGDGGGSGGDM
jgi:hypothetical protein